MLDQGGSIGKRKADHTLDTAGEIGVDLTETASLPSLGDPFFDVWNNNLNDGGGVGVGVGFSGTQLLSLADELGNEDWGDLWLGEVE